LIVEEVMIKRIITAARTGNVILRAYSRRPWLGWRKPSDLK